MKILHVLGIGRLPRRPEEEAVGGTSRMILELARVQAKLGHEVWAAVSSPERWTATWQGIRLVGFGRRSWAHFRLRGKRFDYREQLDAMVLTRARRFDIVHAHEYGLLRHLRARVRVIHVHNSPRWSVTTDPDQTVRRAKRFWADACVSDAQVGVSDFVARQLCRGYSSIRSSAIGHRTRLNVHTVHNGVETERFRATAWQAARAELRQEWGVSANEVVFLFAGAVAPDKGVAFLARAFASLSRDIQGVHLVVAGGAGLWSSASGTVQTRYQEYEASVEGTLASWRETNRAHMLGLISPCRMPAVYAASDVVVLPSVVQEAFPLTVLEALASGKPVIATCVGGVPELIGDDCGILVPPAAETELATAMALMAKDGELRTRMATAAVLRAAPFTWERAANQLEALYCSLLDEADSASRTDIPAA